MSQHGRCAETDALAEALSPAMSQDLPHKSLNKTLAGDHNASIMFRIAPILEKSRTKGRWAVEVMHTLGGQVLPKILP